MAPELRKTGISVVGDLPWGAHFCSFYETKQDLLDILVPYFKTGLENKEFCLWVVSDSELITEEEAREALAQAMPDLDRYVTEHSIEFVSHDQWFLNRGVFDRHKVAHQFKERLDEALARGYSGIRVNGNPAWLHTENAKELRQFEKEVDEVISTERIIASCTYPLSTINGHQIFETVRTHQFAIARRQGEWEVIETPELIQAKAEIRRLNEELEQRVIERTNELRLANEKLRKEIIERKNAEAALRKSEEQFRQMAENIREVFWLATADLSKMLYISPAYEAVWGQSRESLYREPRSFFTAIHAEDRSRVVEIVEKDRGRGFEVEYRVVRSDGSIRWIRDRGFPIQDDSGRFYRVAGIAEDITESKCAEEELKQEKEILGKIFDNIPLLIGFVGQDGRVKLVNPEWERTMGWTLKELREQNVDIFAEAYPDPTYRQKILNFVAAATGESVDLKIKIRDGRVIDAACAVVRLSDGTKVAIAQDITERKQAEEKLRQSESQLAEAQHLANIGSWSLDLNSNTVTWSDELYRIFGVQPSEFDHNYEAVIGTTHPEDREWLRSVIEHAIKTHEPFSVYYRITQPTGEVRVLHAHGAIVTDEHGNAKRLHGTAQDVTERMQAEEKLRATTEQLRALSAKLQSAKEEEGIRIARELHDEMGSTLTRLRWDLERFDKIISEAEDWAELQELRPKIAEMMRLTDVTIGTMRRIASELRPSILDDLGLTEALEWQAQQFQTRTGIVCRCDCSLENLEFDPDKSTAIFRIFQEALTNILSHAEATTVDVAARSDDGEFVLTISDNGKGITEDEKTNRLSLGILGMRERAHLIGGKLEISGTNGRGTVVTVRIPNLR